MSEFPWSRSNEAQEGTHLCGFLVPNNSQTLVVSPSTEKQRGSLYLVLYFHKTCRDKVYLKLHPSVSVPGNKRLQELSGETNGQVLRQSG